MSAEELIKIGKEIGRGKTKIMFSVVGNDALTIGQYTDNMTKLDNPDLTKQFKNKGLYSNTINCNVQKLLKEAGMPVAFGRQFSPEEFLARRCRMIRLEVVVRRFGVGSFLKRHPEIIQFPDQPPHRFNKLELEFFLKTSGGQIFDDTGRLIFQGLDPSKGEEDPIIVNPFDKTWQLFHSKKPKWDETADLHKHIDSSLIVGADAVGKMQIMADLTKNVFLILEKAWGNLGMHFIDLKLEFGYDPVTSEIVIADVIELDNFRIKDPDWKELSKEVFRQGGEISQLEEIYRTMAILSGQLRLPKKQALILWTGSPKDKEIDCWPILETRIEVERVVLSGHKNTISCIDKLHELEGKYPEGGVIIVKVGMSDGLAPILATHTTWPVIAVPDGLEKFPEDAWSSLRTPSLVPLSTICSEKNAVLHGFNILAAKNPALYAYLQMAIEQRPE